MLIAAVLVQYQFGCTALAVGDECNLRVHDLEKILALVPTRVVPRSGEVYDARESDLNPRSPVA